MRIKPLLFIFLLFGYLSNAQKLSIRGKVQDTVSKKPLQNAVIIATKLSDSTLIDFTRSNEEGFFEIKELPIDTYKVVISFKKFGDKIMYVIGTNKSFEFNFDKIIMPPKSVDLDEVTIFAYKDPVYYKGDTLIYTADSFKVKANATVEDLLRRLPGVKVDANGKITSQGKEVSKVLVDGDEFFGTDPTMATKIWQLIA
ncbi:MAG: carboxypeptidase regulatory-like domain-containing protein [Sphingobacteriaceae bacterium]|nr:carboxypeptidase regulatory-like domain-containing protein [Sphingobacteriaceae bacterium]